MTALFWKSCSWHSFCERSVDERTLDRIVQLFDDAVDKVNDKRTQLFF
jgi:hypothetical protein